MTPSPNIAISLTSCVDRIRPIYRCNTRTDFGGECLHCREGHGSNSQVFSPIAMFLVLPNFDHLSFPHSHDCYSIILVGNCQFVSFGVWSDCFAFSFWFCCVPERTSRRCVQSSSLHARSHCVVWQILLSLSSSTMNQCYLVELFAVGHTLIDLVSNEITTSLVFCYWLIPEIYIT